jgi:hypothetical protein
MVPWSHHPGLTSAPPQDFLSETEKLAHATNFCGKLFSHTPSDEGTHPGHSDYRSPSQLLSLSLRDSRLMQAHPSSMVKEPLESRPHPPEPLLPAMPFQDLLLSPGQPHFPAFSSFLKAPSSLESHLGSLPGPSHPHTAPIHQDLPQVNTHRWARLCPHQHTPGEVPFDQPIFHMGTPRKG